MVPWSTMIAAGAWVMAVWRFSAFLALSLSALDTSRSTPSVGGLCLGASEPLLEEVAGAQLADEGDLDRRRVERCGRCDGRAGGRRLGEDGGGDEERGGGDAGGPAGQPRPAMGGDGVHVCDSSGVGCGEGAWSARTRDGEAGPRSWDRARRVHERADTWRDSSGGHGGDLRNGCRGAMPLRSGSAFAARAWDLDEKRSDYLAARASMVPGSAGRHIGQHICAWVVMRLRIIDRAGDLSPLRALARCLMTTGRPAVTQSLYEPAYRIGSGRPAMRIARAVWHAVTPLPHETTTSPSAAPRSTKRAASSSGGRSSPSGPTFAALGAEIGARDVARASGRPARPRPDSARRHARPGASAPASRLAQLLPFDGPRPRGRQRRAARLARRPQAAAPARTPTAPPAARHAAMPPSSTRTDRCPSASSIHHSRDAGTPEPSS